MPTLYRRSLPADLIAFGAPEGQALLVESIQAGDAAAFFPLVAHLHTQQEPAWCGLGTLVTVLNALGVDPGRAWKGPWRFFGETLLDCCKSLDQQRLEGVSLDELVCLARCNGAEGVPVRAQPGGEGAFREAIREAVRCAEGPFMVLNYGRGALGQTGDGHFSPVAAYHAGRDLALILDVARFKYPPHWAPVSKLWQACLTGDSVSGASRGYVRLGRSERLPSELDAARAVGALNAAGACLVHPLDGAPGA